MEITLNAPAPLAPIQTVFPHGLEFLAAAKPYNDCLDTMCKLLRSEQISPLESSLTLDRLTHRALLVAAKADLLQTVQDYGWNGAGFEGLADSWALAEEIEALRSAGKRLASREPSCSSTPALSDDATGFTLRGRDSSGSLAGSLPGSLPGSTSVSPRDSGLNLVALGARTPDCGTPEPLSPLHMSTTRRTSISEADFVLPGISSRPASGRSRSQSTSEDAGGLSLLAPVPPPSRAGRNGAELRRADRLGGHSAKTGRRLSQSQPGSRTHSPNPPRNSKSPVL